MLPSINTPNLSAFHTAAIAYPQNFSQGESSSQGKLVTLFDIQHCLLRYIEGPGSEFEESQHRAHHDIEHRDSYKAHPHHMKMSDKSISCPCSLIGVDSDCCCFELILKKIAGHFPCGVKATGDLLSEGFTISQY